MLGVEIFRPLRELVLLYHEGMVAMSSAEAVFDLMDEPVEIKESGQDLPEAATRGVQSQAGGTPGPYLPPEFRFENVSFAYNQGRRSALQDVSFRLEAGETLGLVGPSGAGKSTIVWLMLRFVDPQEGRVLLGGRDLRDLPLAELRRHIAVVTQDTYLFDGTVADNLRFGKPRRQPRRTGNRRPGGQRSPVHLGAAQRV